MSFGRMSSRYDSLNLLLCPLVLNTVTLLAPRNACDHGLHFILHATFHHRYSSETFAPRGRLSLPTQNVDDLGLLRRRLMDLVGDAIILADQAKFDVFNALTLMDNPLFLQELKVRFIICIPFIDDSRLATPLTVQFGSGDGLLNFYLYSWRSKSLAGMNATEDKPAGRGVGVVML